MTPATRFREAVDDVRRAVAGLRGGGRGWALLAIATGWMLVLGTRVILPALLPEVKAAFAFDNTVAGFLLSALWLAYAVAQFPAGVLSDRAGERTILGVAVVVTATGALALALAPTFALFAAGGVLFGLGTGLYAPPRVTVLSRIFVDRDSTALGVTFAVGNVGAAAFPVIAGTLALVVGWRFGFGFVVPLLAAVAVGLWTTVPPVDRGSRVASDRPRRVAGRLVGELTDRTVLIAWLAMTLVLITYQGITSFLPIYLVAEKGLDAGIASLLYGLFFASGAVFQLIAGGAADRYGERSVLAVTAGFGVLTLVGLAAVDDLFLLVPLVVLLGTRLGIGPVGNGYVAAILSDDVQGSGFGLFRTFYLVVGAVGPAFVGVMAGRNAFDEAFLVLAGVTGLATLLYLALPADGRGPAS